MSYSLAIYRSAQKQLAKIPSPQYDRIRERIKCLSDNPRPAGCKKLVGRPAWRIRVGDYRVIYEIDDQFLKVVIVDIGHRRDIY